jgi:hypothetical protein
MTQPLFLAAASVSHNPSGYRVGKKIRERSNKAISKIIVAKATRTVTVPRCFFTILIW